MQRWVLKASLYPQLHHPATPRSKQGGTAVSEGKARRGLFFFSPLILNRAMCMFHRVQNMSLGTGAPSKAPLVRLCETSGRGGNFWRREKRAQPWLRNQMLRRGSSHQCTNPKLPLHHHFAFPCSLSTHLPHSASSSLLVVQPSVSLVMYTGASLSPLEGVAT